MNSIIETRKLRNHRHQPWQISQRKRISTTRWFCFARNLLPRSRCGFQTLSKPKMVHLRCSNQIFYNRFNEIQPICHRCGLNRRTKYASETKGPWCLFICRGDWKDYFGFSFEGLKPLTQLYNTTCISSCLTSDTAPSPCEKPEKHWKQL